MTANTQNNQGEREALRRLIQHLIRHQFTVTHVDDGGEHVAVTNARAIEDAVFSVDVSRILVVSEVDTDGTVKRRVHSILIVLGNAPDGSEIVSDYRYADGDPDGFDACMDAFLDAENART